MDFEDLRIFVTIADTGGVSPAARRLGLSKSVVSRRLLRLEADLGVQLVARTARGAALTEAGTLFRDHAARVTREIDIARETIAPDGELRGRFRITMPLTIGPTYFTPILAEMARLHPRLTLQVSYTDRFVDLVGEGIDCGIRCGNLQDSTMIAKRVGSIYGSLVASPRYIEVHGSPEAPQDLAAHRILIQGAEIWPFLDGDKIVRVQPRGNFMTDNGTALAVAAASGMGIARLPDCIIHEFVISGALVPVMTRYPIPEAGIYVVRRPGRHPERKVRVLTDLLIQFLKSDRRFNGERPQTAA